MVPTADVDWVRGLRHYFTPFESALGDGSAGLDIAGPAYRAAKGRELLRITPSILQPLQSRLKSASALANWAKDDDRSDEELPDLLEQLANEYAEDSAANHLNYQPWCCDDDLRHALKAAVRPGGKFSQHLYSTGGILLIGPPPANQPAATLDDAADDLALLAIGGEHLLSDHLQHVATWATRFAQACLPQESHDALSRAAWLHDLGKLDPRFQAVLHGDIAAAQTAMLRREYLAKSGADWLSPYDQRRVREQAQLPEGFRHEMLSSQLALAGGLLDGSPLADLILHLVESHHGYARPFAPFVTDPEPAAINCVITIDGNDHELTLASETRESLPPHRLDSGVARRFWQLTRRYGWWGLAYLETLLRLADHRASAAEMAQQPAIQHQG